ncbi:phosphoenolpyruvate mutase [Vreelandella gomseomensis]|uniref:phosphoenolpyruvate mutase n=1 Tax=Vreelandella gomseomensis TaxID=370766 RepID=A0ABU1GDB0_9GAMM|nr:phosphoenolpyruvate mutase [Halomonas gomseomensis]MDR5875482.1 phosphoenolpyruvate mutase [Halomonas gomseomensis]
MTAYDELNEFEGKSSKLSLGYQLLKLIKSEELTFLMEAHDALSAAIVAEAGFPAIWASGFSISTSLGYRDVNECSWTQVVDVVERMVDASCKPILVDGDSGFGNFNNARIFSKKLFERGAAGICIEDKVFPKMNSFVGNRHPLADIGEFCGRLKAIRDTVPKDEFVLIARTEAFIAGQGIDEALDRAHAYAYANAGVDGILIHSRRHEPNEVFAFSDAWKNRLPLVIVPTKYYTTPASEYKNAGISAAIWANHNMRAAVNAMRSICQVVLKEEGVKNVEDGIADLSEVFSLLDYDELDISEGIYLS